MWEVSLEVVGEGWRWDQGRWCSNKESEAECGKRVKDLCWSEMFLRVSPIRGPFIVLGALAREAVRLCFTLVHCLVSSRGQRRCPVYSHWELGCSWLWFRWRNFSSFSPEGSAKGIWRGRGAGHNTAEDNTGHLSYLVLHVINHLCKYVHIWLIMKSHCVVFF